MEQESSSEYESGSESEEDDDIIEDTGYFQEGGDVEEEYGENSSDDDLDDNIKDPDWNANMEDAETDSSDNDELHESEIQDNPSQTLRYTIGFVCILSKNNCRKLFRNLLTVSVFVRVEMEARTLSTHVVVLLF